jgi:ribonuclease-3
MADGDPLLAHVHLHPLTVKDLEKNLGHTFTDKNLLKRALTHASANADYSNERLEFLGDRVLGLIVAEKLHALFPNDPEGALALKYNALARGEACAQAAEAAGLANHIILARSEAGAGGRHKMAILAGTCEAVIAALYLDGGLEAARRFFDNFWADISLDRDMRDPKTRLQEWAQARKESPAAPVYSEVGRTGPHHAPRFSVKVIVPGLEPVTGEGSSKREAEQNAAALMLAALGLDE